jgi:hypothetical protein
MTMASSAAKGSAATFRLFITDGGHVDQVARLDEFRAAYPEVEVKREDGYWRAAWTGPSGKAKGAYAAELEWLLDILDEHFPPPATAS